MTEPLTLLVCVVFGLSCSLARTIPSFVIAGLDPAIHAASQNTRPFSVDHRVKPGGDDWCVTQSGVANAIAPIAQ